MTVRALTELGDSECADAFRRFVERSAAGNVEELQIAFGVGGEHSLHESPLSCDRQDRNQVEETDCSDIDRDPPLKQEGLDGDRGKGPRRSQYRARRNVSVGEVTLSHSISY